MPYPYEEGIRNWPAQKWTGSHGAPGELDEEGTIRKVCVVPKPYQQPHPPIFNAFSVSESTVRWAAKEGTIPHIQISLPESFNRLCHVYQDVARENGRDLKLGESVGASRVVYTGKTYEEAYKLAEETLGWSFAVYYNQFGFAEGFRYPGEDAPKPLTFTSKAAATERLVDQGYGIVGTVDDVKRKLEDLQRCHEDGGRRPGMVRVPGRPGHVSAGGGAGPGPHLRYQDHAGVPRINIYRGVALARHPHPA